MGKNKKPATYKDADEYGNGLTVYRPTKKAETFHMEIENTDWQGDAHVTCINFDFVAASELAEVLIEFSRRLKAPDFGFDNPVFDPVPDWGDINTYIKASDSTCTVDGCLCKADKVEPKQDPVEVRRPYWSEPWGTDWFSQPSKNISTSDKTPFRVTDTFNGEG